ncbi:MAG: endolytic transglycosylase MltG [Breznakia sp.]
MNNIRTKIKCFFSSKLHIGISILFIFFVLAGSVFLYYDTQLRAIDKRSEEIVYFSIIENDTVDSVSNRLQEQGIIKDANMLKLYVKLHGYDHLKVGAYELQKDWSAKKIIQYLNDGGNVLNDQVLLTFREGIWAKEIAQLINENTNVSADTLLALWNDETFLKQLIEKYEFLDKSILNSEYPVKLEGYLFPETYFFKKETTAEEVSYVFLNQFQKEYEKIKKDIEESGYSLHEIMTLASIVQFESASVEDMQKIAGVFYNRLAINQKLESSVTVCYALYDYTSWEECEKDVTIDSPYNTYMYEGLPIGPILNPGKDAIESTLYPDENEYYYFLADVYGDGTVYYSKTYDEHLKKQKKYLGY